jgi:PAS domain S-box-containing protein
VLGGLAQRLHEGMRATLVALGQSHSQRLAALVESSDDAIVSVDLSGTIATWNRGAEELFGYTPGEVIGQSILILLQPDRHGEEAEILRRIACGEHVQHYETVRRRKDGRLIPVSLSVSPVLDGAGQVIGASKIARDMTERKRAEAALSKRADEQAALYEFTDRLFRARTVEDLNEAALDAIIRALACDRASILMFDAAGVMRFVAWRGLSNGYRAAVEGHTPWTREATDPQPIAVENIDATDLDPSLKATVKSEGIAALAFIPLVAKGELVGKFMAYHPMPHAFSEGEINLALTIARQLGFSIERMRADEARELLLRESQHRIKNTLATVQAIAGQTLRGTRPEELEAFLSRLRALGEAHDLLTGGSWHQVPLGDLVHRALRPFQPSGSDRIVIDGSEVPVAAKDSLMLTLCLHELATNAAKYGALSNESGKVLVSWMLVGEGVDRKARLLWREAGGPPVAAPRRKGFGSLLIEQSFAPQRGTCLRFRPDGLECALELPLH